MHDAWSFTRRDSHRHRPTRVWHKSCARRGMTSQSTLPALYKQCIASYYQSGIEVLSVGVDVLGIWDCTEIFRVQSGVSRGSPRLASASLEPTAPPSACKRDVASGGGLGQGVEGRSVGLSGERIGVWGGGRDGFGRAGLGWCTVRNERKKLRARHVKLFGWLWP